MSSFSIRMRKRLRQYLANPALQTPFRMLYRLSLIGMNYGGAGSHWSAGDHVALERLRSRTTKTPIVFDVGANVGGYTQQVLEIVDDATIYAFEPSSAALARLKEMFGTRANVHIVEAGIGAQNGTAKLQFDSPGSVLASTFAQGTKTSSHSEEIKLVSIDAFCAAHRIEHIDLLKLDLEGGELDALRGAQKMLERGAVPLIQFEFGQPSIGARTFFSDIFKLLVPRYDVYRVLPQGLFEIQSYDETLEVFMSTNYLAVLRSSV